MKRSGHEGPCYFGSGGCTPASQDTRVALAGGWTRSPPGRPSNLRDRTADIRLSTVSARNPTSADLDNPIRNDETLAYGQIVCTLAARADIVGVQFAQAGHTMEVPRSDGALTSDLLTEADHSSLIAP